MRQSNPVPIRLFLAQITDISSIFELQMYNLLH